MKTIATRIILVFLSLTVFTTGMGTTIVNFCCDNCIASFFSKMNIVEQHDHKELHSCCAHKSEDNTKKEICHHSASDQSKGKECCKIERHNQILDSYHSKPALALPFVWVSHLSVVYLQDIDIENNSSLLLSYLKSPPDIIIDTRTYLSIIRILII